MVAFGSPGGCNILVDQSSSQKQWDMTRSAASPAYYSPNPPPTQPVGTHYIVCSMQFVDHWSAYVTQYYCVVCPLYQHFFSCFFFLHFFCFCFCLLSFAYFLLLTFFYLLPFTSFLIPLPSSLRMVGTPQGNKTPAVACPTFPL